MQLRQEKARLGETWPRFFAFWRLGNLRSRYLAKLFRKTFTLALNVGMIAVSQGSSPRQKTVEFFPQFFW